MSADRDRQRERLDQLSRAWLEDPAGKCHVDFLLDNGVTVELPPEQVPFGTAGTATVQGEAGVRVMRTSVDWFTTNGRQSRLVADDQVTDFTADPEPLTVEAVQELQQAIETASFSSSELARFVGQRLLPYVAGGAR
jgi:hypothetical protein